MFLRLTFFSICSICYGFNLDISSPVVFTGPQPGSFFGFSIAEHIYNASGKAAEPMVLVGAPKANYTKQDTGVISPGKIYKCVISNSKCETVDYVHHRLPLGRDERGNEKDGRNVEDKTNMWFGMRVHTYGNNGAVVACGHRYKAYIGSVGNNYLLWPGHCIYHGADLERGKTEYERMRKCFTDNEAELGENKVSYQHHQFCMTGVNAIAMKNMAAGAGPGAYQYQGVLYYHTLNDRTQNPVTELYDRDINVTNSAYLGYSVASGNFFGKSENDVVQGAPRNNHTGKVVLFKYKEGRNVYEFGGQLPNEGYKEDINHPGSGFGATVAGVDVNGDGYTDVLVGAPFYSPKGLPPSGRVFVYLNDKGAGFTLQDVELTSKTPRARFGRSISSTGDVNLDGYNDVAVGAPYEDGGAVYIYAGSKDGLSEKPIQLIKAAELPSGDMLKTFGYSLYGGLDLDENGYPDLAAGAFRSDKAFVLKARPLLNVTTKIEITPSEIDLSSLNNTITVGGKTIKTILFSIKTCVTYKDKAGKYISPVEMNFVMRADTLRPFKIKRARVQFKTTPNDTFNVLTDKENCYTTEAFLAENIKIKYPDIMFNVSYTLGAGKKFPMLDEALKHSATQVLKFKRDCEICMPNLNITDRSDRTLAIGGETYTILVDVTNFRDAAYGAVLKVAFPEGVKLRKVLQVKDSTEIQLSLNAEGLNSTELVIDLGNPMKQEKKTFKIELNTQGYTQSEKFLHIVMKATSDNEEPLDDRRDNVYHLNVTIESSANLKVVGKSQPPQVSYSDIVMGESAMNNTDDVGNEVNHTFFVRNLGPDIVPKANVIIQWPFEASNGKHLLYLVDIEVEEGKVKCESSQLNFLGLMRMLKGNSTATRRRCKSEKGSNAKDETNNGEAECQASNSKNIRYVMDCNATTAHCTPIRCSVFKLRKDEEVEIKVISRLWSATLYEEACENNRRTTFMVISRASVEPAVTFVEEIDNSDNSGKAETEVDPGCPQPKAKQPAWIIPVAVVCSLIVLALLVFILYKCGFFKRKHIDGNMMQEKGDTGEKEPMFKE